MTLRFAITGKGGTGKTTFSALLVRCLSELRRGHILAVDADPNDCLYQHLGVHVETTLGALRETALRNAGQLPASMSKQEYIEYQVRTALVEAERFDLLTMGRQEGPGCYCYINNVLRTCVDMLAEKYAHVVIDNEAGMEHLSRRTTRKMDVLAIISNPTPQGVLTAGRIKTLSAELELKIGRILLVVNNAEELDACLKARIEDNGFEWVERIPHDELIERYSAECRPLSELPEHSRALNAVREIAKAMLAG